MQQIPFTRSPMLTVTAQVEAEFVRLTRSIYKFDTTLFLSNVTDFTAEHPFICLPVVGQQIQACQSRKVSVVGSSRKFHKCTTDQPMELEGGETIPMCKLAAFYDQQLDLVGYTRCSINLSLYSLPDLRFACATGAANFPLQRFMVTVDASTIRHFIQIHFRHPVEGLVFQPSAAPGSASGRRLPR